VPSIHGVYDPANVSAPQSLTRLTVPCQCRADGLKTISTAP
jgi:hypothetical protein